MVMMTMVYVILICITIGIISLNFAIQPQTDLTIFSEILTQPTSLREGQYGYTAGWLWWYPRCVRHEGCHAQSIRKWYLLAEAETQGGAKERQHQIPPSAEVHRDEEAKETGKEVHIGSLSRGDFPIALVLLMMIVIVITMTTFDIISWLLLQPVDVSNIYVPDLHERQHSRSPKKNTMKKVREVSWTE